MTALDPVPIHITPSRAGRILCCVEGMSLGHVAKAATVCEALARRGAELHISVPQAHHKWFARVDATLVHSDVVDSSTFYDRFKAGLPPYDSQTLTGYLEQDAALISTVRPDLVLSEFRMTAIEVARSKDVPTIALTEATTIPTFPFSSAAVPDAHVKPAWMPPAILKRLQSTPPGRRVLDQIVADNVAPWQEALKAFGLPQPENFFELVGSADLCLINDLPGLVDAPPRPGRDIYTGPLLYDFPGAEAFSLPARTDRLRAYITGGTQGTRQGTAGLEALCLDLLEAGWEVFLSGGNRLSDWSLDHANLHFLEFVDESELFPEIDLVVHPGGLMTAYRAMAFDLPQLLLPTHANQHYLCEALEVHKLGVMLRKRDRKTSKVRRAVRRLTTDADIRAAVNSWGETCRRSDGAETSADAIMEFAARKQAA